MNRKLGESLSNSRNLSTSSEDLAWIELSSDSSESEESEDEDKNKWGEYKKDWQSIIREGLCQRPQDRLSMGELYGKLSSIKHRLDKLERDSSI